MTTKSGAVMSSQKNCTTVSLLFWARSTSAEMASKIHTTRPGVTRRRLPPSHFELRSLMGTRVGRLHAFGSGNAEQVEPVGEDLARGGAQHKARAHEVGDLFVTTGQYATGVVELVVGVG